MAYPTVPELRAYLGIDVASDDALLADCITEAINFIEGPAGAARTYAVSTDSTRYFDPIKDVRGRALYLDADLASLTSITNGDGATVAATEYVLEDDGGGRNATPYRIIRLKQNSSVFWTYGTTPENAIAVTGKWGYSTSVPGRIARVALELAAWNYRQRVGSREPGADRPLLTGDGVTMMPGTVPAYLMRQLYHERRITG